MSTETTLPMRGTTAFHALQVSRNRLVDVHGAQQLLEAISSSDGYGFKSYNYGQRFKKVADGITLVFHGKQLADEDREFAISGIVLVARVSGRQYEVFSEDMTQRLLLELRPENPDKSKSRRTLFLVKATGFSQPSGRTAGSRSSGRGPDRCTS